MRRRNANNGIAITRGIIVLFCAIKINLNSKTNPTLSIFLPCKSITWFSIFL